MDDESTPVLDFSSKMVSDCPENRRRRFVVSHYLCDKTTAIFETIVPNSGFLGGKFLRRTRVRDPAIEKFFEVMHSVSGRAYFSPGVSLSFLTPLRTRSV
jgi:hypothetical protein